MGMFHCDVCPMNFITESAVRRHLLCSHGRRFHRGRPSSLVPPKLLEAAVRCSRAAQANSRQRRRVCAVQQAPPVNAPPAADTEPGAIMDDFLLGWPNIPPLVVREAATQHDVSWRDVSTSTDRQTFNAAVQVGRLAQLGPGLLASPSWFDVPHITPSRARGPSVRSCRPVPPGGVAGPSGSRGAKGAVGYSRRGRLSGPANNGSAAAGSALRRRLRR